MDGLERRGVSDHMCRITRQRLGFSASNLTMPPSAYVPEVFERAARGNVTRYSWPEYKVPTVRADSLWRRHLERHPTSPRRIDFLKIDVDRPWHSLGLEGLFSARAFKVLVIECDNSWDGGAVFRAWGVSSADQLAWVARMHGYDTFIKVPCQATAAAKSCAAASARASGRRRTSRPGTVGSTLLARRGIIPLQRQRRRCGAAAPGGRCDGAVARVTRVRRPT